jgi:hypothetical protein
VKETVKIVAVVWLAVTFLLPAMVLSAIGFWWVLLHCLGVIPA